MIEILFIIAAPFIGAMIYGLERILKARIQNRQGPPLFQVIYDMVKLFYKEKIYVNKPHIVFGLMHFITLWAVVAYMILGGNLLYVVFFHLLASIFLVLSAFSVKSIYSHVGANRELLSLVAYEPLLILIVAGFYMSFGTIVIDQIRFIDSSIFSLGLLFVVFIFIMFIKLKKSPFDGVEAHQEIVGGVEVEFSGLYYEIIYTARFLEYIFLYMFLSLFFGSNLFLAMVTTVVVFLFINIVDNTTARISIEKTLKIALLLFLPLAVINILGLSYAIL